MASVTSLGIHRPSAIPYLIAESILPADPSENRYSWSTCGGDEPGSEGEEELVTTKTCVVWSQGGIVKRVFRFEVEGEEVQHAVFTWFSTDTLKQSPHGSTAASQRTGRPDHGPSQGNSKSQPPGDGSQRPEIESLKATDSVQPESTKNANCTRSSHPHLSRALVVFLKSQAHVYFVSGTSHIVHLPFEVDLVVPAPHGLIIQRRLPDRVSSVPTPILPPVPQNSFISSQSQLWSAPSSQVQQPLSNLVSIPQLRPAPPNVPGSLENSSNPDPSPHLPRLFSLTDPLAEMGLVVESSHTGKAASSINQRSSQRSSRPVARAEDIVFVSGPNDLGSLGLAVDGSPLFGMALTVNNELGMFTVWSVGCIKQDGAPSVPGRHKRKSNGTSSNRRSSYGPGSGTGANTPIGNWPRDSTGAGVRGQNMPGLSNPNIMSSQRDDNGAENGDEMASHLDPEFENPAVPAKQSRRVSSLLARADLSTNHDRLTFPDLVGGHVGLPAGGPNRRGESFGGYGNRSSFGGHIGTTYRGSMPGNISLTNLGTASILDAPGDGLLEELHACGEFEGLGGVGLQEAVEGFRNEVTMTRIYECSTRKFSNKQALRHHSNSNLTVLTLLPPTPLNDAEGDEGQTVVMCILDNGERTLLNLTFKVVISRNFSKLSALKDHRSGFKKSTVRTASKVSLVGAKRETGVIDAIKLVDGGLTRILALRESKDGRGELSIEAPGTIRMKIDLPNPLAVFDVNNIGHTFSPSRKREGGLKRIFGHAPISLTGLQHSIPGGKVDVLDHEGNKHRLRIKLSPRNELVAKVIDLCRNVLRGPDRGGEGILLGWWEVSRWLQARSEPHGNDEWTALAVTLFTLAVGFIHDTRTQTPLKQRTGKGRLLRSSSAANTDSESWIAMIDQECGSEGSIPGWLMNTGWKWILKEEQDSRMYHSRMARSSRSAWSSTNAISLAPNIARKNPFLMNSSSLAREFLHSVVGKAASGKNGYLPTAASKDYEVRRTALATILVALHLLQEERKLDITKVNGSGAGILGLSPLLAQLGGWLNWENWSWKEDSYYCGEDVEMSRWMFDDSIITGLSIPPQPFQPPSIYEWLERCMSTQNQPLFLTLRDIISPRSARPPTAQGSQINLLTRFTPRTTKMVSFFAQTNKKGYTSAKGVENMIHLDIRKKLLETLPEGVVASMREAIRRCQAKPPTTWGGENLSLIGRDDLGMLLLVKEVQKESTKGNLAPTHEPMRDIHSICNATQDSENIGFLDGSAEADRQAIMRLIFREDRRFNEAAKLVQSMKLTVARCVSQPEWSESDLLEAQKELVQTIALRTLATPAGRGLLNYSARVPLLTEKYPVPGFNLSCLMKPSNNTVIADRSAFTEEKVCWAFFHSGVAAGLSIARNAKGIDTSWIVFNKPIELNNRHAGFLLALGLNGHLKTIAKWVAFKYLTPKHTMTSIGLLLGLAVSYLGTMDSLITRLLSVHVTRMLPPGAAELNLSPLTQTAGILGIGLLYCETQHRRMSEIMLSEIEYIDYDDSSAPVDTLRDEGYRLAAGFSLGFINLGKGRDLKGLHDMHLVERLLALAVGAKKVNIVHILDKATAAATIAITLIFMKSGDKGLSRKIDVPDTILQFDYVRPDIFLLRTVAKHMIMWNDIQPSQAWIRDHLPHAYRDKARLKSIQALNSGDLHFFNVLAGLCFSLGLRFAGSGNIEVRNLLGYYLDQFIRLCRLPAINYDGRVTRSTVRNCQDLVALSAATVMAGTGDLHIFRRLRSLHGWVDADVPYGSHLAAHIAIGVLFLGGGNYTFGTSNLAVASLLCAFYPLFPTSILDNKSHLQAFRHLWVLASQARCLVARDVDTLRPVAAAVAVSLRDGTVRALTTPCLLPELHEIVMIQSTSPEYWSVTLDFARNPSHLSAFQRNQAIFVRRRAAFDAHPTVFSATLQALNDTQSSQTGRQMLEWIFTLPELAGLDEAERALVLPADVGSSMHVGTDGTPVDDKLILQRASLRSGNRDRLWNLRLLFAWAEGMQKGDGRLRWLGKEVVDGLRAAVWMATHGEMSS